MADYQIDYALPVSAVRITGTLTTTVDDAKPGETAKRADSSAELTLVADRHAASKVNVKHNIFQTTAVSLALADDRRLTSASSESTGELGTLIKGVLSFGLTLVTPALGPPTLEELYATKHPEMARQRTEYKAIVKRLECHLLERIAASQGTSEDIAEVRRIERLLRTARGQLEKHEQHFLTWRASLMKTRSERHEYIVPISDFRAVSIQAPDTVLITNGSQDLRSAWENLGLTVYLEPDGRGAPSKPPSYDPFSGVWIRTPRLRRLLIYRRRDMEKMAADLVSTEERLTVDDWSDLVRVDFKTSVWARRKVAVTVSSAGGLASYEYGGDSAAGSIGATLGSLPETVIGGLEHSLELRGEIGKLRDAEADEALARINRRLAQKQAELSLAGLIATEDQYAEVARLKQQKELLELGSSS